MELTDDEMTDILYNIQQLAQALGWITAGVQDKDGALRGMFIGDREWVESKVGTSNLKPIH